MEPKTIEGFASSLPPVTIDWDSKLKGRNRQLISEIERIAQEKSILGVVKVGGQLHTIKKKKVYELKIFIDNEYKENLEAFKKEIEESLAKKKFTLKKPDVQLGSTKITGKLPEGCIDCPSNLLGSAKIPGLVYRKVAKRHIPNKGPMPNNGFMEGKGIPTASNPSFCSEMGAPGEATQLIEIDTSKLRDQKGVWMDSGGFYSVSGSRTGHSEYKLWVRELPEGSWRFVKPRKRS